MVIDPLGWLSSEATADKNAGAVRYCSSGGSSVHRPAAQATLSSDTASVASLVARAMQTAGVRQDRVDSLKASVGAGNYALDARAIASAMLKE